LKSQQIKTEILSGLTISIALVPEAISFALLIGAAPQVGLWAAVIMALSTAIFGGRPGLISGATGATAVILAAMVSANGMGSLALGVATAGIIQLLIWATGAWKVFAKIPHSAISGFLIALAIMIFTSQLNYLKVGDPSVYQIGQTVSLVILCAAAMLISAKHFKFPPALVAIAIGCIIGIPLGIATVGNLSSVSVEIPKLHTPDFSWSMLFGVLPYSFGVAVSGLTESLLTVDSVSHKLNESGDSERETFAQGLGNLISGFLSTMGGCVLVGQTNLNINAGAKHRLSGIISALGLIAIILIFSQYIEMIPLAGLIGVMMVVVYQTGDWKSILSTTLINRVTIVSTIAFSLLTHNLAIGVIIGTIVFYISKLIFKHDTSKK
jgi:SulP family sulfate permease